MDSSKPPCISVVKTRLSKLTASSRVPAGGDYGAMARHLRPLDVVWAVSVSRHHRPKHQDVQDMLSLVSLAPLNSWLRPLSIRPISLSTVSQRKVFRLVKMRFLLLFVLCWVYSSAHSRVISNGLQQLLNGAQHSIEYVLSIVGTEGDVY